jgi:hypothetical protein
MSEQTSSRSRGFLSLSFTSVAVAGFAAYWAYSDMAAQALTGNDKLILAGIVAGGTLVAAKVGKTVGGWLGLLGGGLVGAGAGAAAGGLAAKKDGAIGGGAIGGMAGGVTFALIGALAGYWTGASMGYHFSKDMGVTYLRDNEKNTPQMSAPAPLQKESAIRFTVPAV